MVDQGYTQKEAAHSLDIIANMLGRWIREHRRDDDHAFRGNDKLTPEQEEIRCLREENRQLKLEPTILKEATAFVAREMK